MRKFWEIVLAVVLHPIATILAIVNALGRDDLNGPQKVVWVIVAFIPIGPIVYVTLGDGDLW